MAGYPEAKEKAVKNSCESEEVGIVKKFFLARVYVFSEENVEKQAGRSLVSLTRQSEAERNATLVPFLFSAACGK